MDQIFALAGALPTRLPSGRPLGRTPPATHGTYIPATPQLHAAAARDVEMLPPPGSPPGRRPPPLSQLHSSLFTSRGTRPGPAWVGRSGFRPVAGGPRCRIRSPTGREGRGPFGRGGRPWVVLGRPRVASAGTTCSEGRGRLGGAAWEVEARAPSKPRGQPGLRTPATRPGPQDPDRGPAWPSLPDPS